jgi:site-specific recombinase XerD
VRADSERAVFLTWRGRRMTPRDVQNMLRRAVGRVPAGLRREVTPHGLRHTAFTLLISAGEDPTVVQRLAGHADLSTTGKYRDQLPGELEQAMTHHPVLPSPDR